MLKKIRVLRPKEEEVLEADDENYALRASYYSVRYVKSTEMRWTRHVA
jgi:hypothetical protein